MLNFLSKNKKSINIIIVIGVIADVLIGFLINKVSEEKFNLLDTHNIWVCSVLVLLVLVYIFCQIFLKDDSTKVKNKRMQKAFQDNGGYEAVVEEMKSCIEKHDYKSIKELKKIVDYIEK